VPAGFTSGLPVNLSFIGRAFSEATLIRLAYASSRRRWRAAARVPDRAVARKRWLGQGPGSKRQRVAVPWKAEPPSRPDASDSQPNARRGRTA